MRKLTVLVAAALAALALCCCGILSGGTLSAEELAGRWSGDAQDVAAGVTAILGNSDDPEMQELLSYIRLEGIYSVRELSLSADGSFTLAPSGESAEETLAAAEQGFRAGFNGYLLSAAREALAETGRTEDEYRAELGISASDELLAALDIDADALFAELNLRGRLDGLAQALTVTGAYQVKNGALLLSFGGESAHAEYDKETDCLRFDDESSPLYQLCFYRVG